MSRSVVKTDAPPTNWLSLGESGYTSYCHPPFTCDSLAKHCNKDMKPLKVQMYSPLTLHAVTIFLLNVYVSRVTLLYRVRTAIYLRDLILFLYFPPDILFI